MAQTNIRKKVHQYLDEADNNILEVVYKLLEVYRNTNTSLLSEEQQREVLKRSALYKQGKSEGISLSEARKKIQGKLSK
jgi:hypothetical protein